MEQVKVKELASEFEMKDAIVIDELKKIGVWVPSSDTPVDTDIANRIRKRLQMIIEAEQEEKEAKAVKAEKPKKSRAAKPKRSIKELGRPRKKAAKTRPEQKKKEEEQPQTTSFVQTISAPRKGKKSDYRKPEAEEPEAEEVEELTEVSIEDEPLIERVEAEVPSDLTGQEVDLKELAAQIEKAQEKKREIAEAAAAEAAAAEAEEALKKATTAEADQVEAPVGQEEEAAVAEVAEEEEPAEEEVGPAEIICSEKVTVKDLAEKLQIKSGEIIQHLMDQGLMASINQVLDEDLVESVAAKYGVAPKFVSFEEEAQVEAAPEEAAETVTRAPVVTVMGHVDHGKTTLLDSIRKTKVVSGEAGGITQHIGAYHVDVDNRRIVFIDTPGHQAFTRMRSRGAEVTDIVVLVVAADDGVMPQTVEAIDHARAAGVPIIVAVNKIDKPDSKPDRVKQELTEHELIPEDWGGDTVFVELSALEGTNLDSLLEMILLVADLIEPQARLDIPAQGVILEGKLERGRGSVATVLVQDGTLRIGNDFIAGSTQGKVRAMFDDRGNAVSEAGPSSAVELLGLQSVPEAGDSFQVVESSSRAREMVQFRQQKRREDQLLGDARVSLDDLYSQMAAGEIKELPVVIKADAQGSAEVLEDVLNKLSTEKVEIRIIHKAVGAISESDVLLASASDAIVIGFNVRPEANARSVAEKEGVDIRLYTVIYDVAQEITQAMLGLLEPTFEEKLLGRAEVRDTFKVPKYGTIAGSYVQEGVLTRSASARLLRDNVVVYEGKIDSLRRFKDDVNEVRAGYECGVSLANYNDVKIGDVVEAYAQEEIAPKLE